MDTTPEGGRPEAEARMEALFRRHYRDVAAFVRRRAEPGLVEDVVAETFLVAWRRLDQVPDDARAWLLGVARKALATQRRGLSRRRSLLTRLEANHVRSERADQPPSELGVAEALSLLSKRDREALTLVAWEGLSPTEAALVVGTSPAAFRVRLHRAKRRLRRQLEASHLSAKATHDLVVTEISLTGGVKR